MKAKVSLLGYTHSFQLHAEEAYLDTTDGGKDKSSLPDLKSMSPRTLGMKSWGNVGKGGLVESIHSFTSNLWYQSMNNKVRQFTSESCYACTLLPKSTERVFPYWTVPLIGHRGLPSLCVLVYQRALYLHPALGYVNTRVGFVKPLIVAQGIQISKINVIDSVRNGVTHGHAHYVINTSITATVSEQEQTFTRSSPFSIPGEYPSLMACPTFYGKHVIGVPSDLSEGPTEISATVNITSVYEMCIEGVENTYSEAVDVRWRPLALITVC